MWLGKPNHLDLKQIKVMEDSKKGFCKCIRTKRKTRKNMGSLVSGPGNLRTKDKAKAKVFNALIDLVFDGKSCL